MMSPCRGPSQKTSWYSPGGNVRDREVPPSGMQAGVDHLVHAVQVGNADPGLADGVPRRRTRGQRRRAGCGGMVLDDLPCDRTVLLRAVLSTGGFTSPSGRQATLSTGLMNPMKTWSEKNPASLKTAGSLDLTHASIPGRSFERGRLDPDLVVQRRDCPYTVLVRCEVLDVERSVGHDGFRRRS